MRVAICEDVREVREGFRYLLNLDPEIQVLGAYSDAESLLEALETVILEPDIILMDIGLPGMSGIEATGIIKERFPRMEVLILTIFEEERKIIDAIERGAAGYVMKNTRPGDLVAQIKELNAGGSPISPGVARKLFAELRRERSHSSGTEYHLTAREHEVVHAIVEGLTYREIADRYGIAGSTVKKHILNIYKKLDVRSKVEFMKKVMNSDLI
ncbi:MAG: DNA-binding response regulator [Spirochaetaceae bacterium]|nr:MAG: DNA-binding response regulator [Spirochaetaceae bacterium]